MNINFDPRGRQPKGILEQLLTWLVWGLLLGAALMFSLVFFAVVVVAGLILWLYFWWKTRALREQIRQQMQAQAEDLERARVYAEQMANPQAAGDIIEGEAVRVPEERDRLPH